MNNSLDFGQYCPEWKTYRKVITNLSEGTIVCTNCGTVLGKGIPFDHDEFHFKYGYYESNSDLDRTVNLTTYLDKTSSASHTVEKSNSVKTSSGIKDDSKDEKKLEWLCWMVEVIWKDLKLSADLEKAAKSHWKEALSNIKIYRMKLSVIAISAVLIVSKAISISRPILKLIKEAEVSEDEFDKCHRQIWRIFYPKSVTPICVDSIWNNLKMDEEFRCNSNLIAQYIDKKEYLFGYEKKTIAWVGIMIIRDMRKEKIDWDNISSAAGNCSDTILKAYREIKNVKDSLLQRLF